MKSLFIALMLLLVSIHTEAQGDDCYASLDFYPIDLYPTNQNLFPEDTPFIFSDTTVTIGADIYTIKDIIPDAFNSKGDLVSLIGCIDDFEQFTNSVSGEYYKYVLTENYEPGHDRFILLKLNDCGSDYTLVLTMRGMYRLDYNPSYDISDNKVIIKKPEKFSIDNLLINPDTTLSIEVIKEPEYEIVTEQILLHDAYEIFEVVPAVYDTTYFTVPSETSTCPEAEIVEEEFVYNYLSSPSVEHVVQEATFGLVTEVVLTQSAHSGPSYFKRVLKDTALTIEFPYQEIKVTGTRGTCDDSYFFDCLETEIIEYPGRDTLIRNAVDYCPAGYDGLGLYCYTLADSPNLYERRQYYRLQSPPVIITNEIESQEKTLLITKVINKEELPEDCIKTEEVEVFSLEIVTPEEIELISIPAEYGTRTYRKLISSGEIAVDTSLTNQATPVAFDLYYPETQVLDSKSILLLDHELCTERQIAKELINRGYLQETHPLNRNAYYLAITRFQEDNALDIGAIDWPFIELLLF